MIKKIFLLFFFFNIFNTSFATIKDNIINNFETIDNLSFEFKQIINDKTEEGSCIIQYPKKINCKYDNLKKKIIVSNGNSLVIKHENGKAYFRYLLKQTPLELILNKELLISKIINLNIKLVNDKYYIFNLNSNDNQINIFFDKNSYDLIGWQTEDIYQNLVITFIFNLKKNIDIDKNLFVLPRQN